MPIHGTTNPTYKWYPDPEGTYETYWTTGIDNNITSTYSGPGNITPDCFVRKTDLEDMFRKMHKIITEHTPIDIGADEFVELIMNDR